nr:putative ribonuclease H-like domain-containing protein [Tanacetum cinerariifolium]
MNLARQWLCNDFISKGQKFNFSKYIFDSLARNVDSSSKFYMYPRFIQLIIQNQVGDLSTHTTRFISSALTQKVFANMRRVGKGFSGVETPLFEGMLAVRQHAEEGLVDEQVQVDDAVEENVAEDVAHDAIPSPTPHDIPSPSQEPSLPPQQPQSSPQAPPQELGDFFRGQEGILEQMELLQWGLICQRWSAITATRKGTLQESACHLRTQEGIMMGWEAMTGAFRQKKNQPTMPSWISPPQVLPVLIMRYLSGEGYHVVPLPYSGTFMPPKPDLVFHDAPNVNETVHTAFNVELSPTNSDKDLSHRPSAPIIEDWVSDLEDESEADPSQNAPSFVQPNEQVKTHRPSVKPKTALTPVRNHALRGNHQHYARMTHLNPQRHVVPTAVLTKSKLVPLTAARPVTTTVPHNNVTRPRSAKNVVTKPHSPPRRNINRRPSPKPSNFPHKVTTAKVPQVNAVKGVQGNLGNPQHALKDKWVIDSGYSRHMIGNMSYLSDFEEINGEYVAFGGNPKGGKITRKGKIKTEQCFFTNTECIVLSPEFKLPGENQVLLRVHRENNMYNVDLKNIVPSRDLTCLFAKETLDESNLWHRRLSHINFKTMNKLVKGIKREFSVPRTPQQNGIAKQKNRTLIEAARTMLADSFLPISFWAEAVNTACYVHNRVLVTKPHNKTPYELLLGRTPSIGFMRPFGYPVTILNTLDSLGKFDGNADKGFLVGYSEPEFEGKKPDSEVYVSPSCSAKIKKHDDKTKREAKGKSPVDTPVPTVGQISTNRTNTFSAVGPSNTAVSPTLGESSYVDTSQYPDDPNMPALEDITYSDDEENVGAEADFSNLETTITVSPILTTRAHKDHLVSQIISDLSLATQTRSMTRMVNDQGGLTQINNEDFILACLPAFFHKKNQRGDKKDERGIVVRNKARLVAQRHTQEDGIDYEEVFAPVARIEAIRLFLAYASFMGFMMDVKRAFLYGTIEKKVYVYQPPVFKDPDYPDKVYKVVKVLYGLHQDPKAWYETLTNYLLENGFQRGKIDQTLFIKKQKGDILLVQVIQSSMRLLERILHV